MRAVQTAQSLLLSAFLRGSPDTAEDCRPHGGNRDADGIAVAAEHTGLGPVDTGIQRTAAAEYLSVGVEYLLVSSLIRDSQQKVLPPDREKVEQYNQFLPLRVLSAIGKNALFPVVGINPFKTVNPRLIPLQSAGCSR